jgi:ATP-dependent Zn protease
MSKLRRVAYHEAGHAVACVRFGLAFQHVSIIPSGKS